MPAEHGFHIGNLKLNFMQGEANSTSLVLLQCIMLLEDIKF